MGVGMFIAALDAHAEPAWPPARAYVLENLGSHDIVFMGTTHKQPAILTLIADLLPDLPNHGVTHIAVEIGSDQQAHLDRFIQSGVGLADISLHAAIDCPDYRRLLSAVQQLESRSRPLLTALDLPPDQYDSGISRDEWMARRLADIFSGNPNARVLVVLGSLHVLRKLEWEHSHGPRHAALRTYLTNMRPDLKMHSIVNIIGSQKKGCDFSRTIKPASVPVAVAMDQRFSDWRLGLTNCIAIAPAPPNELTDGIIIY
jgi:hypothetical protein